MRSVIYACVCVTSAFALSADVAFALDGRAAQSATPLFNPWDQQSNQYIVQASTSIAARREIERVGAMPGRELGIINAVATQLTVSQLTRLNAHGNARAYPDRNVSSESLSSFSTVSPLLASVLTIESQAEPLIDGGALNAAPSLYITDYPVQVGATQLQQAGINGKGVTIAVLDTGIWTGGAQNFSSRILASVDIVAGGSQPTGASGSRIVKRCTSG